MARTSANALAAYAADCEWYEDVNACIPVLDKASDVGDQYTQLTLELIVCLENNAAAFTGCERGALHPMSGMYDGHAADAHCPRLRPHQGAVLAKRYARAHISMSMCTCLGDSLVLAAVAHLSHRDRRAKRYTHILHNQHTPWHGKTPRCTSAL